MKIILRFLVCGPCILALAFSLRAGELPQANPADVGISASKLEHADAVVREMIEKKEFAGAVLEVARDGKVVDLKAIGMMNVAKSLPMKTDTIFRIYSMTKPITTVAAMMLWEEGRFQLDDPVSKYIPELKGLRVYVGPKDETVPAKREITIRDLMRHTSGFTYGVFGDTPVDRMYKAKRLLDRNVPLQEFVSRLATIPLQYQPGTRFHYSVSVDVLGRVVEVVSGRSLDTFFEDRIFKPLDMVDTAFFVPASKVDRFATNYGPGLVVIDNPAKSPYLKPPKFFSGGGGMVSTARDYTRFCQMVLNGGELEGARLLKKETVDLMTHNQLPPEALPMSMPGPGPSVTGLGFGLGFAVHMAADPNNPSSVVGEYFWGGAASTGFTICPRNETVTVALTQYMPFTPTLSEAFVRGVNAAVESKGKDQASKPRQQALRFKAR
jgi:CubicO group peptidase (beta-lactamase class C family)